jgi:hypothetical protein
LTVAVRSKEALNRATGATGLFELDPTTLTYPVLGDSSTRLDLAQSNSRAYARYDYARNFLMFGDIRATPAEGRSGLLDYTRSVTGIRGRLEGDGGGRWIDVQASRPHTGYTREILDALTGSVMLLSKTQIVPGTEAIVMEVRDRRNPERVMSRDTLLRNVDYTIDPATGVLQLLRRLPLFDDAFNLVQLVVAYEYETSGLDSIGYVGRGSIKVAAIGLRVGGTAIVQDGTSSRFGVGGIELEQQLGARGRLTLELPVSRGELPSDVQPLVGADAARPHDGAAIRMALERPFGSRLVVHAKHEWTDRDFANPYGVVTVPGQQFTAAAADVRLTAQARATLKAEYEAHDNGSADNHRRTIGGQLAYEFAAHVTATGGLDVRRLDDALRRLDVQSQLATGRLQWAPARRFSTSVTREQNLGDADPTYPDQTLVSAQFDVAPGARMFATQRWSSAPIVPIGGGEAAGLPLSPLSTRETAIGVRSNIGPYTGVNSRYQLDSTINGTDSFAVTGINTRLPLTTSLSADFSLDHGAPLAGTRTGYLGAAGALAYAKADRLRTSARYEVRRSGETEHILSLGGVGRLTSNLSMLLNYRGVDMTSRTNGRLDEFRAALAVRPRQTDRVALLFSAQRDQGGAQSLLAPTPGTTDRLSTDGYVRIVHGLESYSRVAVIRAEHSADVARFFQTRLQRSLTRGFDVAVEGRRVYVGGQASNIVAVEGGWWLAKTLRVGAGYSSDGFANPGALLRSTASRGGPYLVFSTSLASLFDLMGTP